MASASDDDIASCLTGDVIKVYVGPKSKRYIVHKALLTKNEWFRKRIFCYTDQSISRCSLTFTDEVPEIFELLISWLYRKKLKAISTTDEKIAKKEVTLYLGLYLSACDWDLHELQNAVMDELRARKTCIFGFFPRALINMVYENMETESPLRSYIVDSFIYKGVKWDEDAELEDPIDQNFVLTRKRALKNQWDAGNADFVLDCYEALFQLCTKSRIRDPNGKTGCRYHTHTEGQMCRNRPAMAEGTEDVMHSVRVPC